MHPLLVLLATSSLTFAQAAREANYDEAKVGTFTLPPLLVAQDGSKVTTAEQWTKQRRAEVIGLFREHVYGHSPAKTDDLKFEVTGTKDDALGGLATRKFVHLTLTKHPQWQGLDLMLYVPNARRQPAPVFVGLSFGGNHAVSTEPDVPLNPRRMPGLKNGKSGNQASEPTRGSEASRWPLEMLIKHGYAVATAWYGDLEPDHPQGWKDGLRAALSPDGVNTRWQPNDWGAIGAWAWGLSRMLDYLETDPAIDARHAVVIGHSRLGKTALWAGAQDERFAITISNESGEGGAALSRRNFGETTQRITTSFPHWFCGNYAKYADDPNANPVDQHMLIALAAPRPLYIASADGDPWSDPHGEFLSGQLAGEVWALFGKAGTGTSTWPAVNHPVGDCVGYHLRTGKHDVTAYDWEQYLNFAERHFAP
ncbi:MAG: acetylxylan esterase [Verrucomicrobia bacterium]|nr:acetylxylan esterase [Verrucomicrobiota bacterium]